MISQLARKKGLSAKGGKRGSVHYGEEGITH